MIGFLIMNHLTPSLQGGAVCDPVYEKYPRIVR